MGYYMTKISKFELRLFLLLFCPTFQQNFHFNQSHLKDYFIKDLIAFGESICISEQVLMQFVGILLVYNSPL